MESCETSHMFEQLLKCCEEKDHNKNMPVRMFYRNTFGNLINDAIFALKKKQSKELDNIDIYKDRIRMFHVKDAEFNPTGRQGVYSGYQPWTQRAGRFRSLGDGQVDFGAIFSKLTQYGYDSWAVLEWECCLKSPEQGAAEGAPFIARHLIEVTGKAFDDFAGGDTDTAALHQMLGIS